MAYGARGIAGCILICAWVAVVAPVRAFHLDAKLRASIFLRVLGHERTLTAESGELVVAVVMPPEAPRDAKQMAGALVTLGKKVRVAGRSLRVLLVEHKGEASTVEALLRNGVHALYLPAGSESLGGALSRRSPAVTYCAQPQAVESGCMMAVETVTGRPRVVINLALAKKLGLDFDARLLRLARIVKKLRPA